MVMPTERNWKAERALVEAHAGPQRLALLVESFHRLTGEPLITPGDDIKQALWTLPAVVVAHGTEEDPLFFYGNRAALTLFEFTASEFIRLPSRYSAKPVAREERSRLLEQVTHNGFIPDYSGIRTARSGRLFRIEQAIVWNLADGDGHVHGQAARFDDWQDL